MLLLIGQVLGSKCFESAVSAAKTLCLVLGFQRLPDHHEEHKHHLQQAFAAQEADFQSGQSSFFTSLADACDFKGLPIAAMSQAQSKAPSTNPNILTPAE